ncbi:hypothetical protein Bca52824_086583 [Brassica carinata]|uniref:Glycosyltransferase n=2 Tax=Brassica carinata TaxID=52824 RepID=A0A8X7P934_BRACI|nr:hypothetical protein Bca52824_086583 [Brassica carinata]
MKLELVLIPSTGDGHLRPLVEVAKLLLDNDDHLSITVIIIPSMHGFQTTSYSSYIASLSTTSNDRLRFSFISSADRPNSPDAEPNFISYMESYKPVVKATVAKLTDYAQPPLAGLLASQVLPICVVKQGVVTCFLRQARRFRETKGFLVNTFAELEPQAMSFSPTEIIIFHGLRGGAGFKCQNNGLDSADDKQTEILRWLDDQPDRSVVFLCFGSMGGFSEDQAKEIAIALERSSHRFIWCLRRATPMGPPEEFTNLEEILPEGFLDRTSEIGKIIGWAPQRAVLASPAIGGFVSHCGWNSILESLWFGVPIATWPLYAEQQLNAFEMVEELGLGGDKESFSRSIYGGGDGYGTDDGRGDRERVRCLMEKDSDVRDRVRKMSEKSHMAVMDGGSSHAALVKFIQEVTRNIS